MQIKDYHKEKYNPKSAEEFWNLASKIEKYVKSRGWNLKRVNNKGYIGFKYGFFNVFGLKFIGTKSFCLFFKVPKDIADKFGNYYRYEPQWKQVLYKVDSSDIDLKKFDKLFEEAYKYIANK